MSRQTVLLSYTQWKASLKHCSKYFHLPRTKLKSYSQFFLEISEFPCYSSQLLIFKFPGFSPTRPYGARARARERELGLLKGRRENLGTRLKRDEDGWYFMHGKS